MSNTTDTPTVVRMRIGVAGWDLHAGQILPHEGDSGFGPLATLPNGETHSIPTNWCDVIPAPTDRHVITEREDGPDLDDLVRLIRYCREHDVVLTPGATSTLLGPLRLRLYSTPANGQMTLLITEGQALAEAYYVGPDGTVYDCNGEAL